MSTLIQDLRDRIRGFAKPPGSQVAVLRCWTSAPRLLSVRLFWLVRLIGLVRRVPHRVESEHIGTPVLMLRRRAQGIRPDAFPWMPFQVNPIAAARWLIAVLTLLSVPCGAQCQSPRDQVQREITRLEQVISSKPDADENWAQFKPSISASLARAKSALASQLVFLAVEELGNASVELAAGESLTNRGISGQDMKGFKTEWKEAGTRLSRLEALYRDHSPGRIPAAVRALAESSIGQARHLYKASLPYAQATSIGNGRYYIGAALGSAEFAVFSEKLNFGAAAGAPAIRSVVTEMGALEARIQSAYQPPLSIDHHSDFIEISSDLKMAHELNDAALYYGALYEYLDALQQFSALVLSSPNEQRVAALPSELAHARRSLPSGTDSSIAELFLERLSASLPEDQAARGDASHWKVAAVILDEVIPEYLASLKASGASAPAVVGQVVRVTLVRWPYT